MPITQERFLSVLDSAHAIGNAMLFVQRIANEEIEEDTAKANSVLTNSPDTHAKEALRAFIARNNTMQKTINDLNQTLMKMMILIGTEKKYFDRMKGRNDAAAYQQWRKRAQVRQAREDYEYERQASQASQASPAAQASPTPAVESAAPLSASASADAYASASRQEGTPEYLAFLAERNASRASAYVPRNQRYTAEELARLALEEKVDLEEKKKKQTEHGAFPPPLAPASPELVAVTMRDGTICYLPPADALAKAPPNTFGPSRA